MALTPKSCLGPYQILSALGAGGMGEVYRARDTKLNRDVAIKVLPDVFASDAKRLARFTREAQTLAALNHPNIAHIHGLEEFDGVRTLVMELVEGDDLSQRIARGAMPLDEALPVARQIADALEAAHDQGIVHRDLKPANIKVRSDGTVKVLDFGLAKAMESVGGAANASQWSAVTTSALSDPGTILGTAAYMSPEQVRGNPVDRRADIWAFGVVLFEMLTGRRLFTGATISDILASVLTSDPNSRELPAGMPPRLRQLLRRCLQKDPKRRLRDIGEARVQIEDLLSGAPEESGAVVIADDVPIWRRTLPLVSTAVVAAAVAVAIVLGMQSQRTSSPTPLRLSVELGADVSIRRDLGAGAVLSPDGQTLVFASEATSVPAMLHVRRLNEITATPLPGTEDATNPFFSPDGEWIAFFAGDKLQRISVKGGTAVTISDAPNGHGGTWSKDGSIVFGHGSSRVLLRVSSAGGVPERLTSLVNNEISHRWPQSLPGNRGVLYTSNTTNNWDDARIMVQPLPAGPPKLVQPGLYGRYVPSGHLLYVKSGTLYAAPFDLDQLQLTGPSVSVVEGVVAGSNTGGAQFSASETGTLVFLQGHGYSPTAPIALMDRAGTIVPLRATRADWGSPRFSPNGQELAVDISDGKQTDVWIQHLATTKLSRLTLNSADDFHPTWTPDGRRVAFTSTRDGAPNIYWQRADGTGQAERLTRTANVQTAASWHPTGRFLALQEESSPGQNDVMMLSLGSDATIPRESGRTTTVFAAGRFNEAEPVFSPDGRWVAYQSNETGRAEIFVRSFHGPEGKWQVSTEGGRDAAWSRTRPELVYLGIADDRIMVAPYTVVADSFRSEAPRPWSTAQVGRPVRRGRKFDLHPDGERVVIVPADRQQEAHVTIIFNFFDLLKRLAPVSK